MSIRLLAIVLVLSLVPVSLPGAVAATPTFVAQEIRSLAVARDPQGQLWAAWEADSGTDAEIYFSRWSGGAWSPAQAVHTRPDAWDYSPSVAIATSPGSQAQVWLAWTSSPRSDSEPARAVCQPVGRRRLDRAAGRAHRRRRAGQPPRPWPPQRTARCGSRGPPLTAPTLRFMPPAGMGSPGLRRGRSALTTARRTATTIDHD